MATYTISEMADEFQLTVRAIRFWEDRGLLSPRHAQSKRVYSESDRAILATIVARRAQHFTIEEIKRALDGDGFPREQILNQIEFLHLERAEIDKAIASLEQEIAQEPGGAA